MSYASLQNFIQKIPDKIGERNKQRRPETFRKGACEEKTMPGRGRWTPVSANRDDCNRRARQRYDVCGGTHGLYEAGACQWQELHSFRKMCVARGYQDALRSAKTYPLRDSLASKKFPVPENFSKLRPGIPGEG